MKLICPNCQSPIDMDNVNIATDLAECTNCSEILKASELASDVELREGVGPPVGSPITFTSDRTDADSFSIPRRGATRGDVRAAIYVIFWVYCVAVATLVTARDNGSLAVLLTPFWVVGLAACRGILIGITERQELRLGPDTLFVIKKSVISSKQFEIPYGAIKSIDVECVVTGALTWARYAKHDTRTTGSQTGTLLATIAHGAQKTHVGEDVSEPEMRWLVKMLKAVVFKRTGKRV